MPKFVPQPDPDSEPLEISTNTPPKARPIPTPLVDEPMPAPPPVLTDPSAQSTVRPVVPWDREQRASSLVGPFDAFAATVAQVYNGSVEPQTNYQQAIAYSRAGIHYQTNNEPQGYSVQTAQTQPSLNRGVAIPFPARHDQPGYNVAEGDIVTIISGRDGRSYYLSDELPFIGTVVPRDNDGDNDIDDDDKVEAYNGGAGNTFIKVRRQALTGSSGYAEFSDLLDSGSSAVEYDNVQLMKPVGAGPGVRCGDKVMVQRRGVYYFAFPASDWFVAEIMDQGPEAEDDFTAALRGDDTPHYWVKEVVTTGEYVAENAWEGGWTYAPLKSTEDGRVCRWVDAINLRDGLTEHNVNFIGEYVRVFSVANPDTGEVAYVFELQEIPDGTDTWLPPTENPPEEIPSTPTAFQIEIGGSYYLWYYDGDSWSKVGQLLPDGVYEGDMLVWDADTASWIILGVPGSSAVLVYDAAGATHWVSPSSAYMVLQYKADGTCAFDWLRFAGT